MRIPIQNLHNLSADASFNQKNGRANVEVSRSGDTIHIVATCDSLQARCEYYERELTRIRSDTSAEETVIKNERLTGIQSPFKLILTGFIAGIIVTITVFIKLKK